MKETQNTEFKTAWRDEHLKGICSFANIKDGKLLVGVVDNGKVVGVENAKRLMDDLPNKL
jgi:ATP-dependent DNA helicase RecG